MAIGLEIVMIVLFAFFVQYETNKNTSTNPNSTELPAMDTEKTMESYPREWAICFLLYIFGFSECEVCGYCNL